MSKPNNLHDLLIMKLQALYDAEKHLEKALPKMARKATDPGLRRGFEAHARQTSGQAERLEKAFRSLEEKPKKLKGEAIRGLVADAEWLAKRVKDKNARDAGLIASAQYVEHYEMAGYGSAREWAAAMGHKEVVRLLEQNLEEEKLMDEKLNELARGKVNEKAGPGM